MMNETLRLILSFLAGILLGVIFFGGLWWTVQKGLSSKRPALLFFGSLLLRTGVVLAGLYFIGRGNWIRLMICFFGFIIARVLVIRLTRPAKKPVYRVMEERNAPYSR